VEEAGLVVPRRQPGERGPDAALQRQQVHAEQEADGGGAGGPGAAAELRGERDDAEEAERADERDRPGREQRADGGGDVEAGEVERADDDDGEHAEAGDAGDERGLGGELAGDVGAPGGAQGGVADRPQVEVAGDLVVAGQGDEPRQERERGPGEDQDHRRVGRQVVRLRVFIREFCRRVGYRSGRESTNEGDVVSPYARGLRANWALGRRNL
jgi:hypothetical protein